MDVPVKKQSDRSEIEPAADRPYYVPNVDIIESESNVVLLADLPGVSKDSIDITVEQGVLTLNAKVDVEVPENAERRYAEYEIGDYYRSFRLGQEIDRDKLSASLNDGVLEISFPKSDWAKTKKIEVK